MPSATTDEGLTIRTIIRLTGLLVLGAVIGTALIVWRVTPRDDSLASPDAIVVLGGAGQERADLGIALQERYDVPLVLSSSAQSFAENRGVTCPPEICILTDPETTTGEARAVGRLAETYGWDDVAVVTTDFHTARARLLFRQCLGDRVSVVGAEPAEGRRVGRRRWVNEAAGYIAGATVLRAC
jgi:uncharacterized SAM-binding protein YcdF (DUF218 family)